MSLILLNGCGIRGAGIANNCLTFEPVCISKDDVLTKGTATSILKNNEIGRSECQWKCDQL
jgi:hypothetical protein